MRVGAENRFSFGGSRKKLAVSLAVVIFGMMICGEVSANEVTDVDLWVRFESDSNPQNEITICRCKYWAKMEWSAGTGDEELENNPFYIEIWETGEPTGPEDNDYYPPSGGRIAHYLAGSTVREWQFEITSAFALTVGTHHIRAWAHRDDTVSPNKWEWSSSCTVHVVKVDYVDASPANICIYESSTFTAHPDPADKLYYCVEWETSRRDNPSLPWSSWASPDPADWEQQGGSLVLTTCTAGQYRARARNGSCDTWQESTNTVTVDGWHANPPISGAAIKREHAQDWFHISQSCNLRAKGYDADTKCGTEYDDYIKLENTTWSGSAYLVSSSGEQVKWDPTASTPPGGHTIQATIKDDPTNPDGSNTDDGSETPSVVLGAYQAVGDLVVNWANSAGSGNSTVTVSETGTTSDNIPANINDSESVATSLTSSPYVDSDKSFFLPQEPFVRAKWTLNLEPITAPLYWPGKIKVNTDVDVSGTLKCSVYDEDSDLWGQDVSVSVGVGTGPVTVTITPDLDLSGDSCEALAALSWGFSSDLLSSRQSPESEELEKASGDGTGTFSLPFTYAPDAQDHVGVKNDEVFAKAKVGGEIECKGYWDMLVPVSFGSSASMECTDSTVTYYISSPELQNPKYYDADTGY